MSSVLRRVLFVVAVGELVMVVVPTAAVQMKQNTCTYIFAPIVSSSFVRRHQSFIGK